ncbi:hypothetical protein GCM10028818_00010 [Spirosoma horti]
MLKVRLRLYRHQLGALLEFVPHPNAITFREMATLRLEEIVLIDWRGRITTNQALTWKARPTGKPYTFTMPLAVARALYVELQNLAIISHGLQGLLSELDRELKNLP